MEQESIHMKVVNPHTTGIDVGSCSDLVADVHAEQGIREFWVYKQDLFDKADWLEEGNIKTIAMECMVTYWQDLYAVLISKVFHVILCYGKFSKIIKGRKSDLIDYHWIQKLHILGLLTGSFLQDRQTEELRTYCRHRTNLFHSSAFTSKKIQKYFRILYLRLELVVKDIWGVTGLLIIRAICVGESNPKKFATLHHGKCRKTEEEITRFLQSNDIKDYQFSLYQELDTYDHLQKKIERCDVEIGEQHDSIINSDGDKKQHLIEYKSHKRIYKNTPKNIDINLKSSQMFERVNLMANEGMSYSELALRSKVSIAAIKKFSTTKHLSSWLLLPLNNKVNGVKAFSSKITNERKTQNKALRNVSIAIGNSIESP